MNDNFKTALIITTIAVQKINEKKKGIPRLKQKIDNRVKNRKNREIAKRRLCDGLTIEELADEFGYSVPTIKRRLRRSIREMQ